MTLPKLSKLDLQIMQALWSRGALCIREIQETFPPPSRPAYTTVQTRRLPPGGQGRGPSREEDRQG